MEDASGVDLDWFWRGWFYSVDHVDIEITGVKQLRLDTQQAYLEKPKQQAKRDAEGESLSTERNKDLPKRADRFPELKDFYNQYDELKITDEDIKQYKQFFDNLPDDQKNLIQNPPNLYVASFANRGGLVMPILLELQFTDGTKQQLRIPAEIWRRDNKNVSKLIITEKTVQRIVLDPRNETADVDASNNHYPPQIGITDVEAGAGRGGRRGRGGGGANPMQRDRQRQNNQDDDQTESDDGQQADEDDG